MNAVSKKGVPNIFFAGPVPPPVNGMAAVNAELIELLRDRFDVRVLPTSTPDHSRTLRHLIAKIWLIACAVLALLGSGWRGSRTLYASVDDGWGMVGTIAFALAARICRMRVILHHHSFKYLLKRTPLMQVLVFVAGDDAHHVMLCERMEAQFRSIYGSKFLSIVMPNVVEVPLPQLQSLPQPRSTFRIGLLSNLTFEKGLADFVRLHEDLAHEADLKGVLAGPVVGAAERNFLRRSVESSEGKLRWIGPVYGPEKTRFFESIDVFVFPTHYPTEAFPLVLIEALMYGVPVIAIERGCMGTMKQIDGTYMVGPDEEFHSWAKEVVLKIIGSGNEKLDEERLRRAREARSLNSQWQLCRSETLRKLLL